MLRFGDTVLDDQGRPIAGATVTVSAYPSGTATIYADIDGVTEVSGVVSDANGYYEFFAESGRYTVLIQAAGIGTKTLAPVDLGGSPQQDWTALSGFSNGWAETSPTTYGAAAYMVDANGTVHLRGALARATGVATTNETVYSVVGAKPKYAMFIPLVGNDLGANNALSIAASGTVKVVTADTALTTLYLSGVSYPGNSVG